MSKSKTAWHQYAILDLNTVEELIEASRASGRDLFTQLFQRVQAGQALDLMALKEAAVQRDWDALAMLAHTFKGTAVLHGLDRTAALAAEIVAAAQAHSEQVDELCARLPEVLNEGLEGLRAQLGQPMK